MALTKTYSGTIRSGHFPSTSEIKKALGIPSKAIVLDEVVQHKGNDRYEVKVKVIFG